MLLAVPDTTMVAVSPTNDSVTEKPFDLVMVSWLGYCILVVIPTVIGTKGENE